MSNVASRAAIWNADFMIRKQKTAPLGRSCLHWPFFALTFFVQTNQNYRSFRNTKSQTFRNIYEHIQILTSNLQIRTSSTTFQVFYHIFKSFKFSKLICKYFVYTIRPLTTCNFQNQERPTKYTPKNKPYERSNAPTASLWPKKAANFELKHRCWCGKCGEKTPGKANTNSWHKTGALEACLRGACLKALVGGSWEVLVTRSCEIHSSSSRSFYDDLVKFS